MAYKPWFWLKCSGLDSPKYLEVESSRHPVEMPCCSCKSMGTCVRCACTTSGVPCDDCYPSRKNKCANLAGPSQGGPGRALGMGGVGHQSRAQTRASSSFSLSQPPLHQPGAPVHAWLPVTSSSLSAQLGRPPRRADSQCTSGEVSLSSTTSGGSLEQGFG